MARMDNFRRQHKEILQLIKELSGRLDAAWIVADAAEVRSLLLTLVGKLKIHLAMEDDALYPELFEHPEAKVRELAKQYVHEMGAIKPTLISYSKRWNSARAIQTDPALFIRESQDFFAALGTRIQKENDELYPLVDSLH